MAKLKNVFIGGSMQKDMSKHMLKPEFHLHAENLRFHINGGDDNTGKSIKGSTEISDVTEGSLDLKCIGAYHNKDLNVIYYKLASSDGLISIDAEYDIVNDTTTIVLKDTNGTLNYNQAGYITGWDEIDGLQFWSEWGNPPRRINTERAKANFIAVGANGFTEKDIQVIVIPPHKPPVLAPILADPNPVLDEENNMEEKFISFSYRWRYLDGEYSVLSPFTNPAFLPLDFEYDFSEQSNVSMINAYNKVDVTFEIGSDRVTEVQLVFIESESNEVWVIDDFNKEKLGWTDGLPRTHRFDNNKVYRALSELVLPNYYSNVPLTNKAQAMIQGRLLYGYYKENYDIIDLAGDKIEMDYSLELVSLDNLDGGEPSLIPKPTAKSNRDYQVGVIYFDEPCRATTILNSKTDTLFIPNSTNQKENSIDVILKHEPPTFAKYFRFFIRPNKRGYDQIIPTFFYHDGVYRWIKLESADKDKIKEGDYLIVKSDTRGRTPVFVKTKVLEITRQEQNFLQPVSTNDSIKEIAGLYFKIKPEDYHIDRQDFNIYLLEVYNTSSSSESASGITIPNPRISPAHFYGAGQDDLTSSGTYTGGNEEKHRFRITIDGVGSPNTYSWDDGDGGSGSNIPITVGIDSLSNGVDISFGATIGHTINDEWYINARAKINDDPAKAYGFFRTTTDFYDDLIDIVSEKIYIGDVIRLNYDEYNEENHAFEIFPTSNGNYDNIEEWFYKENIFALINAQAPSIPLNWIWFVRGNLIDSDKTGSELYQDATTGTLTMVIKSVGTQNNSFDHRAKINSTSEVLSQDGQNLILLETEGRDQLKDVYFEIGKTYDIVGGYHISDNPNIATDIDQSAGSDLRVKLDWNNAWSYGNAIESYKIKDEFNRVGIATGHKVSTAPKEEYKEVTRIADVQWSDVYEDETNFNGLNSFNLSQINWVKLDKENASIQKLLNFNGDLLVFQEDAIGIMPYNKNIIKDIAGGNAIGIAKDILNKESYRPYAGGLHGVSKNPESVIMHGRRVYLTDKDRGDILRLANNGIIEINKNGLEFHTSEEMADSGNAFLIGAFDPKHKEYLVAFPNSVSRELDSPETTLAFKEEKGFPNYYIFKPDFMLGADNALFAWKKGKMYKMNDSTTHNNFFGVQRSSKIKFFANHEIGVEKVFKAISLQSSHAWDVKLKTELTSKSIPKTHFEKITDYWYSDITGNTNGEELAESSFGLGSYPIVYGEITLNHVPSVISIGDTIYSRTLPFAPTVIANIEDGVITLATPLTEASSFLIYSKNQAIDGGEIRGDVLEIEMTNNSTEEVKLISVTVEASKDF